MFRNRELWGLDCKYSQITTNTHLLEEDDEDEEPRRYIPTGAIQRDYPVAINNIRAHTSRLGYGENYTVEMGFSGAEGVCLTNHRRYFEKFTGPIYEPEVYIRQSITKEYPTGKLMHDFWEKLFSEVGSDLPDELIYEETEK
ncbi:hypothetical protein [Sulfitobacter geojensis]|uniref:hypothetical protein n=1 Tax=Sulfitobacter geojensis TaxID=1342299 RepID=UPI0036DC1E1E